MWLCLKAKIPAAIHCTQPFFALLFWVNNHCRLIFALPNTKRDDLVAQLVEQYTFNVWALGSSPSRITKKPSIK